MKSFSWWKFISTGLLLVIAIMSGIVITMQTGVWETLPQVSAATDCANATVPQTQCQALVDIYNEMGGSSRNEVYAQGTGNTSLGGPSSGWLANNDPCTWHGVTCDTSSPKNVIGLNFVGGKFNYCRSYTTYKAGLTGSFPTSMSNLSSLQTFDISYNTGVNQPSFQLLVLPSSLQRYCFESIGLTELSPTQFNGLNNLKKLYFPNNQITALSPTQFNGLSNLQQLYFPNNQITALSSTQFIGLSNLQALSFSNNQITALSPTQFNGLSNLQQLLFSSNQITGLSPTQFSGLSNLQSLRFFNNQITGLSSTQFNGLSNLQQLLFSNNQITGLSPTQFNGLSNLQQLYFQNNQITGLSPTQFSGLSSLIYLLFNNLKKTAPYFTGTIPASYSGLNFTTNPGNERGLWVRMNGGSNPNTICGQQPTWITNAWNQYFSGNVGNTDLDDLSRFGGSTTVSSCPLGASCNTTADCASGLSCLASGSNYTCQGAGGNQSPTVSLTSPTNGATYTAPASITMTATASDSDGTIASVVFRQGSTTLFTGTTPPYSYTRTGVGTGSYSFTAIATDNSGATTISSAISVTVGTPSGNTFTLTGTLGSNGANASVNVCGTTVTANSSGIFSRSNIAQGTACSAISATKSSYTCTITSQGPSSINSNISSVVGTCTKYSSSGGGGGGGGSSSSSSIQPSSSNPTPQTPLITGNTVAPVEQLPVKQSSKAPNTLPGFTSLLRKSVLGTSNKNILQDIVTGNDKQLKKYAIQYNLRYLNDVKKYKHTSFNKNIKKLIISINLLRNKKFTQK